MNPKFNELFYNFSLIERVESCGVRYCGIKLYEKATGGVISAKISAKQFDKISKLLKELEEE